MAANNWSWMYVYFLLQSLPFSHPVAGVWWDTPWGPEPEVNPSPSSRRRSVLGKHAAGRGIHSLKESNTRTALGGLAPAEHRQLWCQPLTETYGCKDGHWVINWSPHSAQQVVIWCIPVKGTNPEDETCRGACRCLSLHWGLDVFSPQWGFVADSPALETCRLCDGQSSLRVLVVLGFFNTLPRP